MADYFMVDNFILWQIILWQIISFDAIEVPLCAFNIYHRMTPLQKVVFRDLDLHFRGQTFETTISLKRWELAQKCIRRFAVEEHHCESCIPWSDLDLLFESKIFAKLISRKRWKLAQSRINNSQIVAIEGRHCESCTPWPWPTFESQNK